MKVTSLIARSTALSVAFAGALVFVGCGDDTGLATRYPVSGTIKYKDAPVAKGNISFVPVGGDKDSRAASGPIIDGNFTLTTAVDGDGALPGKYKVTVISKDIDMSKVEANAKGGAGHQDDVLKANRVAKGLVPNKYQIPDTSDIDAEVKAGSNKFDFTLKD